MTVVQSQPVPRTSAEFGTVSRVIVGVDDNEPGLAALAAATNLARSSRAELIAVRAWDLGLPRHGGRRWRHLSHRRVVISFSGTEQCATASMLTRRAFATAVGGLPSDVRVTIETPESDPALALVALAAEPGDVLVVGSCRGELLRRLMHGSVSRYCTRHGRCPVVVVPSR